MKNIIAIIFLSIIFIVLPHSACAKIIKSDNAVVTKNEIINDDLFITGDSIKIEGTVNGDVYAGGGNIDINGIINGDVYAGGGSISVSGRIADDAIIAGGMININGLKLGDNLNVFGGNISVDEKTKVGGSTVFGAGMYQNDAIVGRGMVGGGSNIILNGQISKDINIGGETIVFGPEFSSKGNITYYSTDRAEIDKSSSISGTVKYVDSTPKEMSKEIVAQKAFIGSGFKIWSFLSSLLLGMLILKFFQKQTNTITQYIATNFFGSMGWGFISLFLTIPALILVSMTLIGLPIAVILFVIFIFEIYISEIIFSIFFGEYLSKKLNLKSNNIYLIYAVGLAGIFIIKMIPLINLFTSLTILLVSLGAILQCKKQYLFPKKITSK